MKHLRKDDGYVLVYVLIVFTILALVAGSICAMALNNLKAQKADVARMEARYAAEGYLQQFVAEVCALKSSATGSGNDDPSAAAVAKDNMSAAFLSDVQSTAETFVEKNNIEDEDDDIVYLTLSEGSTANLLEVFANDLEGTVRIHAKIEVALTETYSDKTSTETEPKTYSCKSTLSKVDLQYTFYDISYSTGGGT